MLPGFFMLATGVFGKLFQPGHILDGEFAVANGHHLFFLPVFEFAVNHRTSSSYHLTEFFLGQVEVDQGAFIGGHAVGAGQLEQLFGQAHVNGLEIVVFNAGKA